MRRTLTGSLVALIAVSYLLQITIAGYEDRLFFLAIWFNSLCFL